MKTERTEPAQTPQTCQRTDLWPPAKYSTDTDLNTDTGLNGLFRRLLLPLNFAKFLFSEIAFIEFSIPSLSAFVKSFSVSMSFGALLSAAGIAEIETVISSGIDFIQANLFTGGDDGKTGRLLFSVPWMSHETRYLRLTYFC